MERSDERRLLIGYLEDDLPPREREALERLLDTNEDLRAELAELRQLNSSLLTVGEEAWVETGLEEVRLSPPRRPLTQPRLYEPLETPPPIVHTVTGRVSSSMEVPRLQAAALGQPVANAPESELLRFFERQQEEEGQRRSWVMGLRAAALLVVLVLVVATLAATWILRRNSQQNPPVPAARVEASTEKAFPVGNRVTLGEAVTVSRDAQVQLATRGDDAVWLEGGARARFAKMEQLTLESGRVLVLAMGQSGPLSIETPVLTVTGEAAIFEASANEVAVRSGKVKVTMESSTRSARVGSSGFSATVGGSTKSWTLMAGQTLKLANGEAVLGTANPLTMGLWTGHFPAPPEEAARSRADAHGVEPFFFQPAHSNARAELS